MVLVLTGHTLKDSAYTIDFHRGELLRPEEMRGLEPELEAMRRHTRVLDASADQVLHELEAGALR